MRVSRIIPLALLLMTPVAAAHSIDEADPTTTHGPRQFHDLLSTWSNDRASWALLALSATLYAVGVARLWEGGKAGRGVSRPEVACFSTGFAALFVALVSPIHPWGSELFSVHMLQHEILMLVAAPLLVLGRPVVVTLRGLPRGVAAALGRVMNFRVWRAARDGLEQPRVAWAVHGAALWVWHAPALFDAALHSEFVHFLQHASFFGTALLFWWALFNTHRSPAAYGAGVLYLFTTAVHSSILGALLTFAHTAWYAPYNGTSAAWGLSPIEDQQLGGLIMWIPAGLIYAGAGLIMIVSWLRESERLVIAHEARPVAGS